MLIKMFTIYDSKAEMYLQPFCFKTEGQAIRGFSETVNDNSSQISKYPADYTLFEIGIFDDEKGTVAKIHPVNHGAGITYQLDTASQQRENQNGPEIGNEARLLGSPSR